MDEPHEEIYKAEITEVTETTEKTAEVSDKAGVIDYNQFENLEQGRITTRLPIRVKSGEISEENLTLLTALEVRKIPWESVEMIALGMINEEIDTGKAPKSKMRSFLRQFLVGETNKPSEDKRNVRDFCLLDIYIKGEDCPYRIDQSIVNYRGFIEKPGYISADNFNKLTRRLTFYAKYSKLDPNLVAFLTKTKADVKKFGSILDYELDLQTSRRNAAALKPRTEIGILKESFEG
jgi:hypothetical protein